MNYVERPDALEALRNAVITDDGARHIALKGMGGIGKTVLAQSLCFDEVVQQAFPDGVIWITVGKESAYDPLPGCARWVKASATISAATTTSWAAATSSATRFGTRRLSSW